MRTADDASGSGPGGTRWECSRCGEDVNSTDRVEVKGAAVDSEYGSEDMSFDYGSDEVDYSDMSGSVGDSSDSSVFE